MKNRDDLYKVRNSVSKTLNEIFGSMSEEEIQHMLLSTVKALQKENEETVAVEPALMAVYNVAFIYSATVHLINRKG